MFPYLQGSTNITAPQPVLQAPNTGTGDQRLGDSLGGVTGSAPAPAPAGTTAAAPAPAPVYVDPYARWGGRDNYDSLVRNLGVSQQGIEAGGRQAVTDVGNTYDANNRSFLSNLETGQTGVNTGRSSNQLNLRRAMSNIISGVRTGLRSGGVTLANMNATDSGASDAMARAYAKTGNQQAGDVNNKSILVEEDLNSKQGILNRQRDEGLGSFNTYRDTETNRIRNDLFNKLSVLDAQAQGEGLSGKVDMGIVERVIGDAVARMAAVDAARQQRMAGIAPLTPEQVAAEAARMDAAGMEGSSPFNVDIASMTNAGGGIGAPISQLPIFVRRNREQAAIA